MHSAEECGEGSQTSVDHVLRRHCLLQLPGSLGTLHCFDPSQQIVPDRGAAPAIIRSGRHLHSWTFYSPSIWVTPAVGSIHCKIVADLLS